jgi:CDP-diacylglycerol--serine O-phosphatidyltransferase
MDQQEQGEDNIGDSISQGPKLLRGRFQEKVFLIPSLITVLGLFSGFLALISSMKGNFDYAAKCIAIAIILDGLDGRVARRLNATSDFGKELDSLSDVIAFGVAPAVMVYLWAFNSMADEFGVLVSFLYVACGAARLARFNIDTSNEAKKHFVGLPIPGAAAALATIVYWQQSPIGNSFGIVILMLYTLSLGALMGSTIPFYSIKKLKLSSGSLSINLLVISLLVALTWYHSRLVFLLGFNGYVISGPLMYLMAKGKIPLKRRAVG